MESHPGPIFVTGSSGFVGRQIVKRLVEDGYKVRALVRRPPQTAAFGPSVDMVIGDLSKPETCLPGLTGASAVVHAALTDDLSHEPRATSELEKLSAAAGVRKFIHLSSIVVYGNPLSGTVTEDTPLIPSADAYSRTKVRIEEALRSGSRVPELVILRLGCVYGPGGGWWSEGLLNQMRRGKLILVNAGSGTANLIHVADIGAILSLLLPRSNGPLEIFNVTDGTPVAWHRYFSELEKIAGAEATVSMTAGEAREFGKKWLHPSFLRRAVRKLSGRALIYPLDDHGIATFESRAIYPSQKASAVLGFRAAYNLEKGLRTLQTAPSSVEMAASR